MSLSAQPPSHFSFPFTLKSKIQSKLFRQATLASWNAPFLAPCVDLIQLTFLRCLLQEEVKHPLKPTDFIDIIYIT